MHQPAVWLILLLCSLYIHISVSFFLSANLQLKSTISMNMKGSLWKYDDEKGLVAFSSEGLQTSVHKIILLGGLTDGLLACQWYNDLHEALTTSSENIQACLIQPLLSSSYQGYGTGSLQRDTDEITSLIQHIITSKDQPVEKITLIGHSTGK